MKLTNLLYVCTVAAQASLFILLLLIAVSGYSPVQTEQNGENITMVAQEIPAK